MLFLSPKTIAGSPGGGAAHATSERLFSGLVGASLLLHIIGFGVAAFYERRSAGDPPRLIMVDMANLPEPAPPVAPPRPAPAPPVKRSVTVPVPAPTVATGPVHAPQLPVRVPSVVPLGDPSESVKPAMKGEMTVPVAPAPSRKTVEVAPPVTVAQPPAPPPKPSDHGEKLARARASYRALIAALIDKNKEYPVFARRAGQQGTCCVRCTMTCSGEIKSVTLVKSSGYDTLDRAGLRAVQNVGKFPAPPSDGSCSEVSFEVPISFRLS